MSEERALIAAGATRLSPVEVDFHGDKLSALKWDGRVWVSLRRVCEALGLNYSGQLQKLRRKAWATVWLCHTVAEDGKGREMALLDLDSVPMWLGGVDNDRVHEAIRPKLLQYQRECARVLADYFLKKTPVAVMRAWSSRISDHVSQFCCRLAAVHPDRWAVAPEAVMAAFPLEGSDLPDGSMGLRFSSYRHGQGWAKPVLGDVHLTTPNEGCPMVWPNTYHDSEKPHFKRWLYEEYLPHCLPLYLDEKVKRDKPKWIAAGTPVPRILDVGIAADATCRRITCRPAVLPARMRVAIGCASQRGLFDE